MTESTSLVSLSQQVRWLPADMDTPISLFMGMVGTGNGILLESAEVDGRWGRFSILACDMAMLVACENGKLALTLNDDRFAPLKKFIGQDFVPGLRAVMQNIQIDPPQEMQDLPSITRALYGYLGFGMAGLFNPKLSQVMPASEADCLLFLPGTLLVFDHLYNRLCQLSLGEHREVHSAHANRFQLAASGNQDNAKDEAEFLASAQPDGEGYKSWVREIKEMLRQGEAIQVVPSVRFSTQYEGETFDLYRRLRRYNASPYMFFMRFPKLTLFGSSPEVMVSCQQGHLRLSPIAGTRRRGKDDAEDKLLATELLEDPKERAEHVMLVDLARNDLGRIARPASVKVERYMDVERFSHVMHLTSRVSATLSEGLDALDVLAATFPAGTVSGAPKIRAMEIIRQVEGQARGPYAGCVGWLGLDKDSVNLDMGITIRSMWRKEDTLFWQAGGGIVHDSNPELEWKEVCNKSAIMRLALCDKESDNVSAHR